eukprot:scaffold3405_cov167-Amphora_coffeaeformis.AAC.10
MADIPMCKVANAPTQALKGPKLVKIVVVGSVLSKSRKEVEESNPQHSVTGETKVSRQRLTVGKRQGIVVGTKPLVLGVLHEHSTSSTNNTLEWIISVMKTKGDICGMNRDDGRMVW